jgi:serine/threonine protein kinase
LKEFERQMHSLRKEIETLAHMGEHPYVLRLIGAVTTRDIADFCIVTEYCEFGSLDKFLVQKSSRNQFENEIIPNNDPLAENSRTTYRVSFVCNLH